jgi:hypothetical protein
MLILRPSLSSDGDDELVSIDRKVKDPEFQLITPELEASMSYLESPPPIIRILTDDRNHNNAMSIAGECLSKIPLPNFDTPPGHATFVSPFPGLEYTSQDLDFPNMAETQAFKENLASKVKEGKSVDVLLQSYSNRRLKLLPRSSRIDYGSRNRNFAMNECSIFPDESTLLIIDQDYTDDYIRNHETRFPISCDSLSEDEYWQEMSKANVLSKVDENTCQKNEDSILKGTETSTLKQKLSTKGTNKESHPQDSQASSWEDFHDTFMSWCFSCNYS